MLLSGSTYVRIPAILCIYSFINFLEAFPSENQSRAAHFRHRIIELSGAGQADSEKVDKVDTGRLQIRLISANG
jgi:hypothetical protein